MKTVGTIGEFIIDFIPRDSTNFLYEKKAGGAPVNVAVAVVKQGGKATYYGQVGNDPFGEFLIHEVQKTGVNTDHILRTDIANTGLAFISLDESGDRSFTFYRNPSADMLYSKQDYLNSSDSDDILVFGSVSLVDYPVKQAHLAAIDKVKKNKGVIVFDPNIRLKLWPDEEALRSTILDFVPMANIIKITDDELLWITEEKVIELAIHNIMKYGIDALIITMGSKGARIITEKSDIYHAGFSVKTVDTTGAGDAFLGSVVYQLSKTSLTISQMSEKQLLHLIIEANAVGALTTTRKGAINSIPTQSETNNFLASNLKRATVAK